jgi:outer membrane protein assembly factor BamA
VRVTFVVNEGQRTGIAAINFTGNNSYQRRHAQERHQDARDAS